jgi:diphthamide synthase subunit DPH2
MQEVKLLQYPSGRKCCACIVITDEEAAVELSVQVKWGNCDVDIVQAWI